MAPANAKPQAVGPLKERDTGMMRFAPRPGGTVVEGIEWKAVRERPLDDGGPINPFEVLPLEFSSVPAIEHLGRVVDRFPHKICVDDGTNQLTFARLHSVAVNLAHLLSALVPAGQAVGLMMPNCIWQPVAMIACMAAKRPCLPLNCRDLAETSKFRRTHDSPL